MSSGRSQTADTQHASRFCSSGAPLFFESAKRQRSLAVLAHAGPMRLHHILKAIGARTPPEGFESLLRTGVLTWDKQHRSATIVDFNPAFPGVEHLRAFLKQLEPAKTFALEYLIRSGPPRHAKISINPAALFGGQAGESRTRVLVALCALGGNCSAWQIATALRSQQNGSVKKMLNRFAAERALRYNSATDRFSFARRRWTPELLAFLDEINRTLKIQARPTRVFEQGVGASRSGRFLDFRKPVVAQRRPRTWRPPADGAPLLFGTDLRRRLLCGIADGPVRTNDLLSFAETKTITALDDLEHWGLIMRYGSRSARFVAIHPALPAREEFVAFLRALRRVYMTDAVPPEVRSNPASKGRWQYEPLRFFGSWQQTETLIALSLVEELDATQVCDALHHDQPGYHVVLHLLRKLCHQRILLHRQLGKLILYRLNPKFSVAKELRSFLDEIAVRFPRYQSGVESLDHSGTPLARKLRRSSKAIVAFPPAIDPDAAAQ